MSAICELSEPFEGSGNSQNAYENICFIEFARSPSTKIRNTDERVYYVKRTINSNTVS